MGVILGRKTWEIGRVTQRVVELLDTDYIVDTPIHIGEENIEKIRIKHPEDFEKYEQDIGKIISSPDYIAKHPKDNSIQYVKVYRQDNNYVMVAVRASGGEKLYVRTLFVMSEEKIFKYWRKNVFKSY